MGNTAENSSLEVLEEAVVHAECELEVAESFLNDRAELSPLQVTLENIRSRLGAAQVKASEKAHEERRGKDEAARQLGQAVWRMGDRKSWQEVRNACLLLGVDPGAENITNSDVQGEESTASRGHWGEMARFREREDLKRSLLGPGEVLTEESFLRDALGAVEAMLEVLPTVTQPNTGGPSLEEEATRAYAGLRAALRSGVRAVEEVDVDDSDNAKSEVAK